MKSFICLNCNKKIENNKIIDHHHRNHCPHCLFSLHLDEICEGTRSSDCRGLMKPIGLTYKKGYKNKYKKEIDGELMLVHKCQKCDKFSINRLAQDDDEKMILELFYESLMLKNSMLKKCHDLGIEILNKSHEVSIIKQLKGESLDK